MTFARIWPAFVPYIVFSIVHVVARFMDNPLEAPTKLLLMPFLALAVVASLSGKRGVAWKTALLLIFGILTSWMGDGSATFFPMFANELPMMLLMFGLAHLAYMWVFAKSPGIRTRGRIPKWSLIYVLVYVVLMWVLFPHTGALTIPVIFYGMVLAGTAILASRVSNTVAWGGFWFLMSDAILSFRVFMPELMPAWTSGAVMLTYTLGQFLIGYGVTSRIIKTKKDDVRLHLSAIKSE